MLINVVPNKNDASELVASFLHVSLNLPAGVNQTPQRSGIGPIHPDSGPALVQVIEQYQNVLFVLQILR